MAEFEYRGVDKTGKKVSGKLEALDEGELRMVLRREGIRPNQIAKAGTASSFDLTSFFKTRARSVATEAIVSFTRQLQILISSGIPLVQGLDILVDQTNDTSLRSIVIEVRDKISQGAFLWEALSGYPQAFPKLYVALIRAGESSGSTDQMLKRLSRYLEDGARLKKMIKGAMMYPVIVVCIGVGVIALMLIFVIPKFEEMLTSAGQELPLPTLVLIRSSHWIINNLHYIVGVVAVSSYVTYRYSKSDEGRAFFDRVFFQIPIFGVIMQKGGIARFARTLQTLLSSGLNLIDAVDICKATIDNAVLEESVGKIRKEVEEGKSLGVVINKMTVFPKMAVQMISVGESTGNLDKMLEKVADFYEEDVEESVKGLTKLIEPFIIVFLGVSVGGILIAMYMPIFKLAGSVQ